MLLVFNAAVVAYFALYIAQEFLLMLVSGIPIRCGKGGPSVCT